MRRLPDGCRAEGCGLSVVACAAMLDVQGRLCCDGCEHPHEHSFGHFDRVICACGTMHSWCDVDPTCTATAEPCELDGP